jgi:hypothetical protein
MLRSDGEICWRFLRCLLEFPLKSTAPANLHNEISGNLLPCEFRQVSAGRGQAARRDIHFDCMHTAIHDLERAARAVLRDAWYAFERSTF